MAKHKIGKLYEKANGVNLETSRGNFKNCTNLQSSAAAGISFTASVLGSANPDGNGNFRCLWRVTVPARILQIKNLLSLWGKLIFHASCGTGNRRPA